MSVDVFQHYSRYYDLLYRDKDYRSEVGYIVRLLQECLPGSRQLLEFGSGTGRHGRLLAAQGYEVFGIERSETMAAASNQVLDGAPLNSSGTFNCVQGDIQTKNVGRVFDAVLALFHVISYQTTNEDLLLTFNNAARHVKAGGLFLFDVWHGPAVLSQRPEVRVKRVEDVDTLLTRIAEPLLDTQSSVVNVNYTMLAESKSEEKFVKFGEAHRMRYLFPTEIEMLAKQSGFEVERSEEFLTGNRPSESTWGVAHVLRRKS